MYVCNAPTTCGPYVREPTTMNRHQQPHYLSISSVVETLLGLLCLLCTSSPPHFTADTIITV